MKTLGQIFYGRGPDGYGVLGASPAGRPFLGAVASLCRAVGSPDRPGEIPTFLLSKREGDAAIMIRACRGAADPTGRATVFFHALVADAESLRATGLDAFAFAESGTFASTCSLREPPDLVFPDAGRRLSRQAAGRTLDLPATISSDRPLDSLVRRELGPDSLDKNWATFSYNPLPGFDLCVLSSYSPRNGGGTLYAFDGAGVHRLSSDSSSRKSGSGTTAPPSQGCQRKFPSAPLLVSLVANALLVCTLMFRGGPHKTDQPEGTSVVTEMTESDARAKWEEQWKSEWEKSLPAAPAMSESEAKAKWEARWKSEWEKSLPPPAMTEEEAKAKWEVRWKAEWEKALPQRPHEMTEDEAKAKWEELWRNAWAQTLRKEFEKTLRASGGVWPVPFDDKDSPFRSSLRTSKSEPDDPVEATRWRIYRSCKACAEFIANHLHP